MIKSVNEGKGSYKADLVSFSIIFSSSSSSTSSSSQYFPHSSLSVPHSSFLQSSSSHLQNADFHHHHRSFGYHRRGLCFSPQIPSDTRCAPEFGTIGQPHPIGHSPGQLSRRLSGAMPRQPLLRPVHLCEQRLQDLWSSDPEASNSRCSYVHPTHPTIRPSLLFTILTIKQHLMPHHRTTALHSLLQLSPPLTPVSLPARETLHACNTHS